MMDDGWTAGEGGSRFLVFNSDIDINLRELVSTTVILTPARVPGVATRARCSNSAGNAGNGSNAGNASNLRHAITVQYFSKTTFFDAKTVVFSRRN